ncbi:octopamine receptor-like [Actinia tenebrosa]|uniref:Octopamine receptor-like n=1 Tax=Actinia tenebrosa TaxID=6105 RepID=A0A6P8J9Y5_ACTTE|nr:octopamine receptor-like [Actinia tenebrosa]
MTSIPQEMQNNSSIPKNFTASYVISDCEAGLQAAVLILILIVASVGNGFVGFCVFTHQNLQVPTNYFLVSLATADFLFAILALPFRIYDVLEKYKWELGLAACRFWVWLDLLFCSASIASLAAISVDRYLKISSPLTYNSRMTRNRVRFTLALLWMYSAILASLLLVEWSPDPADIARGTIVENGVCRSDDKIFLTIISVLGFFAPLTIMLLMYFFVFKVAVIQATRVARQQQSLRGLSKKSRKRRTKSSIALLEVKATKTLIILLSVFCICWCPYFIISLISLYRIELIYQLPGWFTKTLRILFVNFLPNVNAALDPIVYTTNNHQFRTVIRRMVRKQRERARGIVSSVYSEGLYTMSESRGRRSSSLRTKSTSAVKNSLTPLPLLNPNHR